MGQDQPRLHISSYSMALNMMEWQEIIEIPYAQWRRKMGGMLGKIMHQATAN